MDLNKMFQPTEDQKILSEINGKSAYTKDMEMYMSYGYSKGIEDVLKLIKDEDRLDGKEIYEIIVKGFDDKDDIGSMIKRLLKD